MPDKKNNKKRKRFFLVDYENVKSDGLQGVDELDKNDNVIIFYSANAGKLSFDLHTQLLDTKSKVTYFEVDTIGQNALDFQLSSYIGYILGKKSDCECYIISNDRGFENVCNFWRTRGIRLRIVPDILHSSKDTGTARKSEIKAALKDMDLKKEEVDFIKDILIKTVGRDDITLPQIKNIINQSLCKAFGSEKTKEIYSKVKPFIK